MNVLEQYRIGGDSASALARSIEAAVGAGRLGPGAALPTVRALAGALRLSPTTVAAAYGALRARGLLTAAGRRGTRVGARPPLALPRAQPAPAGLRDLSDGNPDPELLPRLDGALRRSLARRAPVYGEPLIDPRLLVQARRLFEQDELPARHLGVVSGAMDGVERVLLAHLRPGDRVAVEDPGYVAVLDLLAALGLVAVPVPLDDSGATPDGLQRALRAGASAVLLTPRAQNPSGAAFDEARARALQRVLAAHPGVLLIEDDHAGPVAGAPALHLARAGRERWAVVRSVSKSLGPDLRLALLCGDPLTVARVEGRQALGCGWVSHVLQGAVAALLSDAAVQRRLREAARTYAARREELLAALRAQGLPARGRSGLNVWVPVREEAGPLAALAAAGWAVRAGERYRLQSPPALRVTAARLRPGEAGRLAADLAAALRPGGRTRPD